MTKRELRAPRSKSGSTTISNDLLKLEKAPIAELRHRWTELFRTGPPKAFGPDLLRRSIAQHLQIKMDGHMSKDTQQILNQLVKTAAQKSTGSIRVPRRMKPGSELVRSWKGKSYRIFIQKNGFAYDGKTYSNLSVIAKLITGTKWNGPRFFGLRSKPHELIP